MKRFFITTFILLLLTPVFFLTLSPRHASAARQIAAQRECSTCHIMWLEQFRQKKIKPLMPLRAQPVIIAGKQGVVSTERMCYTCHDGFILDSRFAWKDKKKNFHPIGVKPQKVEIPRRKDGTQAFPLDKDGKIYCGTCHSAHGVDWDTKDSPIFLRESNKDSMMCMICHIDRATGPVEGNHPINKTTIRIPNEIRRLGGKTGAIKNQVICQSCHRVHGAAAKKLLLKNNDNSQLCGTCHSDRYAKDLDEARTMSTHPVNITSERIEIASSVISKGGRKGVNGEIICQTCHKPHYATRGKGILIMGNIDSNLCKECHSDKKSVLITKHNLQKTSPGSVNIKGQTPSRSGPCSVCHLPHRGSGPKMWAQKIEGTDDPISNMCKSCHSSGKAAGKKIIGDHSHPVNIEIARVGGESTLPIFTEQGKRLLGEEKRNGKVLCASCHDVHQWNWKNPKIASAADEEGDATNSFLRKPAAPAPDLCADCHRNKKYVIKTDHDMRVTAPEANNISGNTVMTAGVCGSCHMIHNAPNKAKLWARELSGKGDIIAQLCTSCHKSGGVAGNKLTGEFTHPTGKPVSYLDIKISEAGEWSHPLLDQLNSIDRVKLTPLPFFDEEGKRMPDGNVSCGSCHDPHQWDPNKAREGRGRNVEGDGTNSFLRIAKDPDSALCKNCHVEKRSIAFSKHNLKITSPGDKNVYGKSAKKTGICSSCHLPHNGTGPKMWARKEGKKGDAVERLCTSCHASGKAASKKLIGTHSHPVGRPVSKLGITPVSRRKWEMKSDKFNETLAENPLVALPLYARSGEKVNKGNVSCGSCHDPHQWDPSTYPKEALMQDAEDSRRMKKIFKSIVKGIKREEGNGTNSFLRISNAPDSNLCKNCHVDKRQVELSKHNLNISAASNKNMQGLSTSQSGSCSACHLPHNGSAMKMWARPLTGKEDTISNLCKSCHAKGFVAGKKFIGDYSHPVNADINKVGGKTDFPLYNTKGEKTTQDLGGRVVCTTCHDPHQWDAKNHMSKAGASKDVEGDAKNSFLRLAAFPAPELCINCHGNKKYVEFTDHDLSITAPKAKNLKGQTVDQSGKCGFCHMVHNSPNAAKLWALEPGPGDDAMETLCRSCHLEGRIAGNKRPQYFNHPPDIKATSNVIRRKKGQEATPMPVYDEKGKLKRAGIITCPTCHNPHQWSALEPGYGPGKNTEGNNTNSFLRSVSNLAFCSDCHGFDGLFRYKYYHGKSSRKKVPIRGNRPGF